MTLREGRPIPTCEDCVYWRRCKSLIQDLTGKEPECDFAPSRFVPLTTKLPVLEPALLAAGVTPEPCEPGKRFGARGALN